MAFRIGSLVCADTFAVIKSIIAVAKHLLTDLVILLSSFSTNDGHDRTLGTVIKSYRNKRMLKCMKNSDFAGKLLLRPKATFASQNHGAHVDIEGVLVKFSPSVNGF